MMIKGIDVSVWNGNIDWTKASKEVDFAILRAGYGRVVTQKDKSFDTNYNGCKANGVKVGVYWYNYAETVDDAKLEARTCLAVLANKKLDMPIWYDIEEKKVLDTGKDNVSAIADAFLKIISAAGYKVGIYSTYSALNNVFSDEVKNKYDIWLAHVGTNGAARTTTPYKGKKAMWQYSWKGNIAGMKGDVDLDYCYATYWEEETKETVATTPTPAPVQKTEEKVTTTVAKETGIDVYYGSYIGRWLGEIKNCNDVNSNGYSGIDNTPISGFTARTSKGTLKYRVHIKGSKWLGWIEMSDRGNWAKGIAGIKGKTIDAIQMELVGVTGYKVQYRVSVPSNKGYLPWVTNWNNSKNGYAGIFGSPIDKIQVKIVKA